MHIIDSQLHEFGPSLQWEGADESTRNDVMTELLLAWMDSAGIQSAVVNPLNKPWLPTAIPRFPDRLAGVYHLVAADEAGIEDQIAKFMEWPGTVGFRVSFGRVPVDPDGVAGRAKFEAGAFNPIFAACQKHDMPLFFSAFGSIDLIGRAAKAYPRLRAVVDHIGIAQPPLNEHVANPWEPLAELLPLGKLPNVHVKLCGAPVLSQEGYPYRDIWPHIHRILKAFDVKRVMWASDIGRFEGRISWKNEFESAQRTYAGKHNYAESLHFILHSDEVSQSEKEELLGGAVRRLTGWNPKTLDAWQDGI